MTALNIAFVALAILGNEFIRRRDRRGWWFWLPGNLIATVFFVLGHEWWTSLLYAYYSATACFALRDWRLKEQHSEEDATLQVTN